MLEIGNPRGALVTWKEYRRKDGEVGADAVMASGGGGSGSADFVHNNYFNGQLFLQSAAGVESPDDEVGGFGSRLKKTVRRVTHAPVVRTLTRLYTAPVNAAMRVSSMTRGAISQARARNPQLDSVISPFASLVPGGGLLLESTGPGQGSSIPGYSSGGGGQSSSFDDPGPAVSESGSSSGFGSPLVIGAAVLAAIYLLRK